MVSQANKFQCKFRTVGLDKFEISTTFEIQQEKPDDWNLYLEIFVEKVQSAISTINELKKRQNHHQNLEVKERQMLTFMVVGFTATEIASKLDMSVHDVNHLKKSIQKKLSISPSTEQAEYQELINQSFPSGLDYIDKQPSKAFKSLSKTNGLEVSSYEDRFMQKVMTVLENHRSNTEFNTDKFSQELCMSRSQLHRKLKSITGYTTGGLIRAYRLEYGRKLIDKKFGNMAQTAFECGFSNPSYFSECFKRQFGLLPSEYSRSLSR